MARVEVDPNYTGPTFSRATAGTDLFKKEDVQQLAAAVSTHVHDGVHGLGVAPAAATIPGSALTNGSVTLAKLAADSVDSSKIVDGTIATADLANAAVTNAKLASDTARANLLTNGGFEIWQRGNGPFTADAIFTADRWKTTRIGTDTISISKDTTNKDLGSQACAAITFTLGTGAGATALFHDTNTADGMQLGGVTLSLSVRVRTATANACRISIGTNGTGSVNVFSPFHTGSGTYQTLTTPPNAIPADATIVRVNVFFAASCTAYVDNAMLVVGSVAADYAPLHPADDLARCLRYYEVLAGAASWTITGQAYSTTQFQIGGIFRTIKPVVPTMTASAPSDLTATNAGAGALAVTSIPVFAGSLTGWTLNGVVAAGLVAGNATNISPSTANTKLFAEGNP